MQGTGLGVSVSTKMYEKIESLFQNIYNLEIR